MDALPLTTETLDDIPENYRSLYAEKEGGGGYGFQTPDALLNVGKHEKSKRQEVAEKLEKANAQLKELALKAETAEQEKLRIEAEKTGNFDSLKKSFEDQKAKAIAEIEGKYGTENSSLKQKVEALTVELDASSLASRIFGEDADVLRHVVKDRLAVDYSGDLPQTIVLKDGKPSALTLDDLYNEISNDSKYARFVTGSKASGGGANGSSAKGGGASQKTMKRSDFDALSHSEKAEISAKGVQLI